MAIIYAMVCNYMSKRVRAHSNNTSSITQIKHHVGCTEQATLEVREGEGEEQRKQRRWWENTVRSRRMVPGCKSHR